MTIALRFDRKIIDAPLKIKIYGQVYSLFRFDGIKNTTTTFIVVIFLLALYYYQLIIEFGAYYYSLSPQRIFNSFLIFSNSTVELRFLYYSLTPSLFIIQFCQSSRIILNLSILRKISVQIFKNNKNLLYYGNQHHLQ